jgi:hypothetical protein
MLTLFEQTTGLNEMQAPNGKSKHNPNLCVNITFSGYA